MNVLFSTIDAAILGLNTTLVGMTGYLVYKLLLGPEKYGDFKQFMSSINIQIKHKEKKIVPKIKDIEETNYGQRIILKAPLGISSKDFEKELVPIREYFNAAKLKVKYITKGIYHLHIYTRPLPTKIKYEPIKTKGIMEIIIGMSYDGPLTLDLGPDEGNVHLLLAAQTGGGKSVLLRSIIANQILTKDPKLLKLFLVDPKKTEFHLFKNCTDMVKGYASSPKEAVKMIEMIEKEVHRRNDLIASKNLSSITDWNAKYKNNPLEYWQVVVDEFHLLRRKGKEAIEIFEELAAISRSAGIHFVLCTQSPRAKIITGPLKANIPSIIALKVVNKLNSRIILGEDSSEASKLRGKGHGILKAAGDKLEFQSYFLSIDNAKKLLRPFYKKPKGMIEKETKKAKYEGEI